MVEKIGEWDWEDQISEGFQQLVVQDNETGECWTVSPNETDCLATVEKPKGACSRMKNFKSCWKVPKEYSLLGCSKSAAQAEDTQPILSMDTKLQDGTPTWTCENDDTTDKTAIIATFPPTGRLPAFCRKRRCSTGPVSSTKATVKKSSSGSCGVERFLEGRERLLFVGRLLFAFLVLLSPGYFFPLLFFIRTYCHYWKHSVADQEEEIISPSSRVFGFLHTKTFLKYSCRLCREQMKTEKMFRIHSKIGPGSLQKNTKISNFGAVDSADHLDDGCHHDH